MALKLSRIESGNRIFWQKLELFKKYHNICILVQKQKKVNGEAIFFASFVINECIST